MANEILNYVGSQIKMFRKIKKMTIEDLAKIINKSKSTISKYESGEIAIDITTLYDIAKALNISIINLVDYEDTEKIEVEQNHFWLSNTLYMYHQSGKKIYCSVLHLRKEETKKKTTATLYYKVEDINDLKNCQCVYQGNMNSNHDNILNLNLTNCLYDSESVLINFFIPMKKVNTLAGLMSGLEDSTLRPSSIKVVLSKNLLSTDEQKELLQLSKDVIKRLKDDRVFRVDD